MTEKEKMLAGELYDCADAELMSIWYKGKNLAQKYNNLAYEDNKTQQEILSELLGEKGNNVQITAPFYVDYGKFIFIGDNTEINMNCVFLDCNKITIGHHCLIAPSVQIYTAYHPLCAKERFANDSNWAVSRSAPVKIGNYCWIGGGSIILPGVEIGNNCVIGAGRVVTKNIPDNSVAVGNPCRVIKTLPESSETVS